MSNFLCQSRLRYQPKLPECLASLRAVGFQEGDCPKPKEDSAAIEKAFPHSFGMPQLHCAFKEPSGVDGLRVGVVFSGGQAAGGHNVITGLFDALATLGSGARLFGFLNGPSGIVRSEYVELSETKLKDFRNIGGFHLIGSGRTKIESEQQMRDALASVEKLSLNGLVIIGGDDSNTNAALLAEYFLAHNCRCRVVGVPKTIDGDLRTEDVAMSFGFDTATKVYSEMIGNIAQDALSAKKYYHFIKLMGRSASHVALECALKVQANYTLISEEVAQKKMSIQDIADALADLVQKRAEQGKQYGLVLIPEGLIEFIPEMQRLIEELNRGGDEQQLSDEARATFLSLPEGIRKQLLRDRDPHGNVQVSHIPTEMLFIEKVTEVLEEREYNGKFTPVSHFFGYEGRSAFPSNFDATYCYTLGHVAALLIRDRYTGYMACVTELSSPVNEWGILGVPIPSLLRYEMRKGKEKPVIEKALVDLQGASFTYFSKRRERWEMEDHYLTPGPMQFAGSEEITDTIPLTLQLEQ